ncbi:hypothetical protein MHB_0027105 [Pseudomonas fluorescens BBc6R8]|uniref:hypothetical protein n=1 Tax=Pseudomonas fluorescens TaxID=294 RepID=UPI000281C8F9|nr:hypothetical protein [Pseudomonas fluorescens]QQD53758.1 hypothetical protein MHB_0027105 [Pseudomonas fluorescens BBc6R8]
MSIEQVNSLKIIHVDEAGIPNEEHIAIKVLEHCELSEYCLIIGLAGLDGRATPVKDHMLWFGYGAVAPDDWIIVYTASGTTRITPTSPPGSRVIAIHWGKEHTIFQNRSLVPMIIRIGAVGMEEPPEPQYQGVTKEEPRRLF